MDLSSVQEGVLKLISHRTNIWMVPVPIARHSQSSRLVYILFSFGTQYVPHLIRRTFGDSSALTYFSALAKRNEDAPQKSTKFIVFACIMPILVLLSGLFAGLTLGYMSLDETQLNVLSISGTPEQRKYAIKIMPVRKNGHLLLVTLLLCNMIVNESLPVIADPVLGGGVQGVVVATALIVIFAEIIPQSLFTRHGLYLGAKLAGFTQFLIYSLGIISWPVAKLLEFVLGPHHGIIYRRAELKELIAMHSSQGVHGGDLKTDTVTIIGATLDLQEKVVKQAMTPIEQVFMLSIDSKLDYNLLKRICQTGHSRVPVYEEIEVPERAVFGVEDGKLNDDRESRTMKVKKIIGILLVKQCVLLDPKDATPLRKIPLNKVPFVPNNEPLLGILDKFQGGGSHMAIVSRFSAEKAASVKKAVKRGLTQRLRARVKMGDTDSDTDSGEEDKVFSTNRKSRKHDKFKDALRLKDLNENNSTNDAVTDWTEAQNNLVWSVHDAEKSGQQSAAIPVTEGDSKITEKDEVKKNKHTAFQLPKLGSGMTSMSNLEQSMPADAVLNKESAAKFLHGFDPAVMPLGIITLEDVLEELIGEEIYDEFDNLGVHNDPIRIPAIQVQDADKEWSHSPFRPRAMSATRPEVFEGVAHAPGQSSLGKATGMKGRGFFRTRSAPPISRAKRPSVSVNDDTAPATAATATVGTGHDDAPLPMPDPVIVPSRGAPSVILEQFSTIDSTDTGVSGTLIGADTLSTSGTKDGGAVHATQASSSANVGSRLGPSGPSLEAILLDRKRRLAAAGGGNSPAPTQGMIGSSASPIVSKDFASSSAPASPSPAPPSSDPASRSSSLRGAGTTSGGGKGTKFKSSPLGGGERTGVVVAEKVGAAYPLSAPGMDEKATENEKND